MKIEENFVIHTAVGSVYGERSQEQVFFTAVQEVGITEQRFVS